MITKKWKQLSIVPKKNERHLKASSSCLIKKELLAFARSAAPLGALKQFDPPYVWVPPEQEAPPARLAECIAEIRAFVHGDIPGLARLQQVYPSILAHFRIRSDLDYYHVMYTSGAPFDVWKDWPPPSSSTTMASR